MTEQQHITKQHDKSLLTSRFVERALGYSWIKFGWETATKTYETVKQSNRLTKYGCELAEGNVSKVVHSTLVEGGVQFLAPLIVLADEFSVRQLDKVERGAEFGQMVVRKAVVEPVTSTYNAVTSLPSRLLDRAESLVEYYLPEEKHKSVDEGPTAGTSRRKSQDSRASYVGRVFDLAVTTAQRTYARMGYENLKAQATEKIQSYETLNDLIVYMKTSDPEKKEKLVKQGRDIYWNLRNNYKAIFIQSARAVVQPLLVSPALKFYNCAYAFWDRAFRRILLRGPFSPQLARPTANTTASS